MTIENDSLALTFDDVSLVPEYSGVRSRKDPNISADLGYRKLDIPIVSAPMNTVTEHEMSKSMINLGGDAVIHRYMTIEEQVACFYKSFTSKDGPFVAVGATGDFLERARELYRVGVRKICIDVANGHSKICIDAVRKLKKQTPDVEIMAGNVCTYDGTMSLLDAGARYIRVGIGGGSACSTRCVTGFGVPQLTAIQDCSRVIDCGMDPVIIADGGLRTSGDIVKALVFGADVVMVGGLLAGSSETPGDPIRDEKTGILYKHFAGMASEKGRENWFDRANTSHVPEGASFKVPYKGATEDIVNSLMGGLRVGMSYAGALTLSDLRDKVRWVRVTDNGRREGSPNERMHRL